jgi:hypothetical protein
VSDRLSTTALKERIMSQLQGAASTSSDAWAALDELVARAVERDRLLAVAEAAKVVLRIYNSAGYTHTKMHDALWELKAALKERSEREGDVLQQANYPGSGESP